MIADAPLSDNDLYEFDIRALFNTQKAMLGNATLDESDIETWHIRLGHRNTLDLTDAVRKNLVSGPPASVVTRVYVPSPPNMSSARDSDQAHCDSQI